MQITVINNRPSTGDKIWLPNGTSVAPGATAVLTGRSRDEAIMLLAYNTPPTVKVLLALDANDRSPLICDMKNPADPAGGANTLAGVGFDLETESGAAANVAPQMWMGVFDDAACTIPAVHGTLNTASAGTINSGAGTNLLKVTPSATGEFACTLTDTTDEKVYLKAWQVGTSYIIDAGDTDDVTFTP